MRISKRKPSYKKEGQLKKYRINQQITAPEIRLIDENGQNLGIMPTRQAIKIAQEKELDLIEVSPLANPPVAKILDFNRLRYREEKEKRKEKAKQKKIEIKGIRLSLRIGEHDLETRIKQSQRFLTDGNKVKVELNLKGRERQHQELAISIINQFLETLGQTIPIRIEQPLNVQNGQITIVISKK